jgi:hypothetical protein
MSQEHARPQPSAPGRQPPVRAEGGGGGQREELAPVPVGPTATGHHHWTQGPAAHGPGAKLDLPDHTQPGSPLDPRARGRTVINTPPPRLFTFSGKKMGFLA